MDRINPSTPHLAATLIAVTGHSTCDAARFDLLCSRDPGRPGRHLSEGWGLSRLYPWLRYVRKDEVEQCPGVRFWRAYFPDLRVDGRNLEDFVRDLWEEALAKAAVHRVGYAYRPLADLEAGTRLRPLMDSLHQEMFDGTAQAPPDGVEVLRSDELPTASIPARIIERRAGLERKVKGGLGLLDVEPGFLLNYMLDRETDLRDLLTPQQFEEFTGVVFREAGWQVELTGRSADGGKDVIATRVDGDAPVVAYIQAKRWQNAVGLPEVKEFVATVAGDGIDRGFLVTTSRFTRPGREWNDEKGIRLAPVVLLDRSELTQRLAGLVGARAGVFTV